MLLPVVRYLVRHTMLGGYSAEGRKFRHRHSEGATQAVHLELRLRPVCKFAEKKAKGLLHGVCMALLGTVGEDPDGVVDSENRGRFSQLFLCFLYFQIGWCGHRYACILGLEKQVAAFVDLHGSVWTGDPERAKTLALLTGHFFKK